MLNLLDVKEPLKVNGVQYANSREAYEKLKGYEGEVKIELNTVPRNTSQDNAETTQSNVTEVDNNVYRIHVKKWMLEHASPGFDFMSKWNNDIPMPLVIMKGNILEETKGMLRMNLTTTPEPSTHCFKCGRQLTNKVSVLYGIGPECGGHFNINPLHSEEALNEAMEGIKERMAKVVWEGWIPKSSIKEMKIVEGGGGA